jgi:hypothetical protein
MVDCSFKGMVDLNTEDLYELLKNARCQFKQLVSELSE